jgi:hypothetical protein
MHRCHDSSGEFRLEHFAAFARDPEAWTEKRLGRSRTKANQNIRFNDPQFSFEPRPTSRNISRAGFLVDATLAPRFPFKMFYRISDIDRFSVDPDFFQRSIQNLPRWSDKGFPAQIFLIARLFTEKHQGRPFPSFAEDGLGCLLVERTGRAVGRGIVKPR